MTLGLAYKKGFFSANNGDGGGGGGGGDDGNDNEDDEAVVIKAVVDRKVTVVVAMMVDVVAGGDRVGAAVLVRALFLGGVPWSQTLRRALKEGAFCHFVFSPTFLENIVFK